MKQGSLRRWPLVFLALILVGAIPILWPKPDPFLFLRRFHPIETISENNSGWIGDPTSFKPDGTYSRSFDFHAPVSDVYACIASHYKPEDQGDPWSYGATQTWFAGRGVQKISLSRYVPVDSDGITCSLTYWDVNPPTWLERQIGAVKAWLHLR
jgi:hypothetical protein